MTRRKLLIVANLVAAGLLALLPVALLAQTRTEGVSTVGSPTSAIRPTLIGAANAGNLIAVAADSAGRFQLVGAVASGSTSAGNPLLIAGEDGSQLVRICHTDSTGRQVVVGDAAVAAAAAGNPLEISGVDSGTKVRRILTDDNGSTRTAPGSIALMESSTPVYAVSNGTSTVSLVAAAGGIQCFVGELIFDNSGGSTRKVTVTSTGGKIVSVFHVPSSSSGTLGGGPVAYYYGAVGDGLQFALDGGTTDVTVTGTVLRR